MATMLAAHHPIRSPARTYLFVPGHQSSRLDKAWESAADAVIVDLEDAVPPSMKAQARQAVSDWLTPDKPVWIRCNAANSAWFEADIALAARPGVEGVMLPKAEQVPASLLGLLRQHRIGLIPLIETAQGVQCAEALAQTPEVVRLALGTLDLQVDLGIEGDDDALLYVRSRIVLASRLSGKPPPIDGPTPSIDDMAALLHDTERARRLGFGARLCIHPTQVQPIHDRLAPTPLAREWAARVINAMDATQGAPTVVDGKMVDLPVLLRARVIQAAPTPDERLRC